MRKVTRTIGIIGSASVGALIILATLIQTGQLGIAAPDECLPTRLSDIPAKGFPIREPRMDLVAPGAGLKTIDENKDLVKLYYANFNMCPFDESPDAMVQKGAVVVTIFRPQITLSNSSDFQQRELAYYTSNPDIVAAVKPAEVNGYKGVGWEPYPSQSVVRLNGEVIESTPIQGHGAVRYYNDQDGTVYFITANKSLEEILEIARSIK